MEMVTQIAKSNKISLKENKVFRTLILENLAAQAQNILKTEVTNYFEAFDACSLGNFPFCWLNPQSRKTNHFTYNWISSNLSAKNYPALLSQHNGFTNYYAEALRLIIYQLSKTDQEILWQAKRNAAKAETELLISWQATYSGMPSATPTQQPIEIILNIIANTWASPATNLTAIQTSKNLNQLLNKMPASGRAIVPVLKEYLDSLGNALPLQNAVVMNTGYLQQVINAVKTPSSLNGGLILDNGNVVPSYTVLTDVGKIAKNLQSSEKSVVLELSIHRCREKGYRIFAQGKKEIKTAISDLLSLEINKTPNYFEEYITKSSETIDVRIIFPGITSVKFKPADFNRANGQGWFWIRPIIEAIENENKDVSGFKFLYPPQIDFSHTGPFGYLTGAAISAYPTILIKARGSRYQKIAETCANAVSIEASLLGITLNQGSELNYLHSISTNSLDQSVTIELKPTKKVYLNSRAWVLGVETSFPAS